MLHACVVSVLIRCLHREHVCNINMFRVKPEKNGSKASFPLLMTPPSSSSLPTLPVCYLVAGDSSGTEQLSQRRIAILTLSQRDSVW